MARYLEYEKASGRIISEIISTYEPIVADGVGLLEIASDVELDTNLYSVKNGVLVKQYETNEERTERERLKREHQEKVRKRVQSMVLEVPIAILEGDDEAIEELRKEYRKLKALM